MMSDYEVLTTALDGLLRTAYGLPATRARHAEYAEAIERLEGAISDLKTGYTVTLGGKR